MQKIARMLEYATVEYMTRYVEEYLYSIFSNYERCLS